MLRVLHDSFTGDTGKVIDLFDLPAPALGIAQSTVFMMLRAVALGGVFGGNAYPDAF